MNALYTQMRNASGTFFIFGCDRFIVLSVAKEIIEKSSLVMIRIAVPPLLHHFYYL